MSSLPIYNGLRVVSSQKRGSSRPALIETDAGYFLTKLRGAAQGTSALVPEIIVSTLAEALGLWVPCQALISIDSTLHCDGCDDEFLDLLAASYGINWGVQYLLGARDIRSDDIEAIDEAVTCQILWLDALVMNVDRTPHNPNLMVDPERVWLIDHGAALPFHYNWSAVLEDSPRQMTYATNRHLFGHQAHRLAKWDDELAIRLSSRAVFQEAVARIPDCFLHPLLGLGTSEERVERRRQAYAAFLWKRLKAPRPWISG